MKIKVLALAFLTALTVTGCVRFDETISYTGSDEITINTKSYVETSVYDEIHEEGGAFTVLGDDFAPEGTETVNGTEYYYQNNAETVSEKKFADDWCYAIYTKDSFYGDVSKGFFNSLSSEDVVAMGELSEEVIRQYLDGYRLIVNLDSEVVETNGKVDGNSVVFEYDFEQTDGVWYAYTSNSTHTLSDDAKIMADRIAAMESERSSVDTVKPVIKLVKSKINLKKVYVLMKDDQKLKKVVINGKKYTSLKKRKLTSRNYKGYYCFFSTKKGKNSVKAYDASGNVRKVKFTIK